MAQTQGRHEGFGLATELAAMREKDMAALALARDMEARSRKVTVRIDPRTVITTTPEKAEKLRQQYAVLLGKPI